MTIPPPEPEPATQQAMAPSQALQAAKKELRSRMKAKLSSVPKSALESQSKAAFEALLKLAQYRGARRISVYLSMPGGEIQTDAIVRHALGSGKDVFVPYLCRSEGGVAQGLPGRIMDMVRLRGVQDYEGLERDAWGIPTVTEKGVEGRERILGGGGGSEELKTRKGLDLVLMPGVAFQLEEGEQGLVRRLGHGKGFYDYFLHRYRMMSETAETGSSGSVVLYGLALKEQFLQDEADTKVPVGPHDSLLDGLIVGDGQIIQRAASK